MCMYIIFYHHIYPVRLSLSNIISHPSLFQVDRTDLKLADITKETEKQLSHSCQCSQTSTVISEESFACFDESPTHVTFRARLNGVQEVTTAFFLSSLKAWTSLGPAINVRGILMLVDDQCPLAISSFSEEECSNPKPPTVSVLQPITSPTATDVTMSTESDTLQSDNTAAIVGGVVTVVVVLIVAVTVFGIIAVVIQKGRRGSMTISKPVEE